MDFFKIPLKNLPMQPGRGAACPCACSSISLEYIDFISLSLFLFDQVPLLASLGDLRVIIVIGLREPERAGV